MCIRDRVRAYGAFATAPVADAMHRMCAMTPDVRLLSDPVGTMSGVALTVKARPGDSLMICLLYTSSVKHS